MTQSHGSPAGRRPDPQVPEKGVRAVLVGLGRMGVPMGTHLDRLLTASGGSLTGVDLSSDARARARSAGLATADGLADALTDADLVILMLPGSRQVEAVLRDPANRASLRPGTVVVDMSSSEPLSTRTLVEELSPLAIRLVDAPVSGGVVGAVNGSLTVMVGGDPATVDQVEPYLQALGTVVRTGPVGSGHALKALNNLLSGTTLLISSEALSAGRRFGLSDEVMLSVINASTGRSWSTEFKWPTFVVPETYDSGFAMSLLVKDMRIATALARDLGLPSTLGQHSLDLWTRALHELGDEADHTEIARFAARRHDDGNDA